MSSPVTDAPESASAATKTLGRVKWFNNKVGYGFITVVEGEEMDVFVHHSSIVVAAQQYKYLVEGEYVHFILSESSNEEHKFLATEVSGIYGGKLMCETRNLHQENRREREGDAEADEEGGRGYRRESAGRGRGRFAGGKGGKGRVVESYDGDQWMLVRRGRGGGRGGGRGPQEDSRGQQTEGPGAEEI